MIELYANKAALAVKRRAIVTSGASEAYHVKFQSLGGWDGLKKIAAF